MKINVCRPSCGCRRFRLFPRLLNCITRKKGDPRIYRWLWLNWCIGESTVQCTEEDLLGELLEVCEAIDEFFYGEDGQTWRGHENMDGILKHAYRIHTTIAKIKSRR